MPNTTEQTTKPQLIGASVDGRLDAVLWELLAGKLELWQLAPGLAAWWHVAYDAGYRARQAEIDRLNAECDRLYARAYNTPAQRKAIIARELDAAAADYWTRFIQTGGDL